MGRDTGLTNKYIIYISILFVLSIITLLLSISIGSTNIEISEVFFIIFSSDNSPNEVIIQQIRIPRVLLAYFVGGALAISGAVFQSILRNPLAEPYILGVSGGGTFGAVFAMLLGLSFLGVQLFAFLGALGVIALVYFLSKRFGELSSDIMLLTGVMISAFFGSLILLMFTFLGDNLRDAIYWIIGSVSSQKIEALIYIIPIVIICSMLIVIQAFKLNVLSLGDEQAKTLGLNASFVKKYFYILTSLMVGIVVSVSGLIGFVGLIIPHIVRLMLGIDNKIVIPASFLLGGIYLTIADTISRTIIYPVELPVGAITSIVGAPIFIYLLRRRGR